MRVIKADPDSDTISLTSTIDNDDDDEFKDALDNLDENRPSKSVSFRFLFPSSQFHNNQNNV